MDGERGRFGDLMILRGVLRRIVHGNGVEGHRSVPYPGDVAVYEGRIKYPLSPEQALASSLLSRAVPLKFTLRVRLRSVLPTHSSLDPGGVRYTGWFKNLLHNSQIWN